MSTRAALFIQNDDNTWLEIYSHFDGYPSHMLPALRAADPLSIIAAGDVRQIHENGVVEALTNPRQPKVTTAPRFPEWAAHAYVLTACGWEHAADDTELHDLAAA
jgi:hypothetical protein